MPPKKKFDKGSLHVLPDGVDPASGTYSMSLRASRLKAREARLKSLAGDAASHATSSMPLAPLPSSSSIAASTSTSRFDKLGPGDPHIKGESASQSKRALADRADAPVIKKTVRGDINLALAAADDEHSKRLALAEYEKDKFSATSTRESLWHTWLRLFRRWHGEMACALPLTVTIIASTLAQLKAGGYRTPGNYMSRAKDEHIKQFPWTADLEAEANAGVRSASRGLGPPKQSEPYPILAGPPRPAHQFKDS